MAKLNFSIGEVVAEVDDAFNSVRDLPLAEAERRSDILLARARALRELSHTHMSGQTDADFNRFVRLSDLGLQSILASVRVRSRAIIA